MLTRPTRDAVRRQPNAQKRRSFCIRNLHGHVPPKENVCPPPTQTKPPWVLAPNCNRESTQAVVVVVVGGVVLGVAVAVAALVFPHAPSPARWRARREHRHARSNRRCATRAAMYVGVATMATLTCFSASAPCLNCPSLHAAHRNFLIKHLA